MPSDKSCCVPGCKKSGGMHKVLHGFPNPASDRERFNSWLHEIGCYKLLELDNMHIFKYRRVCRSHFEDKYLCRCNKISSIAIPTLNLPGVLLHRFPNPSNPVQIERFRTWIMKIGGNIVREKYTYIYRNRKVCHRHFEDEFIFPSMKLSPLALPTLHIPETQVNLHKFPNPAKNKELFDTWVYAIGGDILQLENDYIFKYCRVCRVHFELKYWCRNNRITNDAVPMIKMPGSHRFPKPDKFPEQFKQWVHLMGGKLVNPEDHLAYQYKRLCDRHFTAADYNRNNRLSASVVPSQYLPLVGLDFTLHMFPNPEKEFDRFNKWIYAIGGNVLVMDPKSVFKNARICHIHFVPKFYSASKRLNRDAIPSLHLSQSNCERDKCTNCKSLQQLFFKETLMSSYTTNVDYVNSDNIFVEFQNKIQNPKIRAQLEYVAGYVLKI